eukprot:COSAG02_NODE_30958_length_542_cov_0.611738_1_plen_61_part_00
MWHAISWGAGTSATTTSAAANTTHTNTTPHSPTYSLHHNYHPKHFSILFFKQKTAYEISE